MPNLNPSRNVLNLTFFLSEPYPNSLKLDFHTVTIRYRILLTSLKNLLVSLNKYAGTQNEVPAQL
jgi:hypothetical protein